MNELPKIFKPDELELIVNAWVHCIQDYDTTRLAQFMAVPFVPESVHANTQDTLEQMVNYVQTVKVSQNYFYRIIEALRAKDTKKAKDLLASYKTLCETGVLDPDIVLAPLPDGA